MINASDKDKYLKDKIRLEFDNNFKTIRPKQDWELIWVLTGYEKIRAGGALLNKTDTGRRLETGIKLAKKIVLINKKSGDTHKAPKIYLSGYNSHNRELAQLLTGDYFKKNYSFPRQSIIVGPKENILHTGDQFAKFPNKFLNATRIIIVTDVYHIPRAKRYLEAYFPSHFDKFIFYPSRPISLSQNQIESEIIKIISYWKNGTIPLFIKNSKMKIVISGASGFIGAHLLNELKKNKAWEIVILSHRNLLNKTALRKNFFNADVAIHLAGIKRDSVKADYKFNLKSTGLLLKTLVEISPYCLFIFPSSFAVYRSPKKGEIVSENFDLKPRNDYGLSKLECEQMIRLQSKKYGLRSVIFRISNVYGRNNVGSWQLIDRIRLALLHRKEFLVRGDGEQARDFIYVTDVINAFKIAILKNFDFRGTEVFNLCTNEETNVKKLIKIINSASHKKLRIIYSGENLNEYWRGSFKKAENVLQWEPKIRLKEGISLLFKKR